MTGEEKKSLQTTFRADHVGRVTGIIKVRSTGHYVVRDKWRDREFRKDFIELFWCVRGCGEFRHENEVWLLRPGEAGFYLPGDIHRIVATSPEWEYYFLTFDGKYMPLLNEVFSLRRQPVYAGKCPEKMFRRLAAQLRQLDVFSEAAAAVNAYDILMRAALRAPEDDIPLIRAFRELIETQYDDPALDVDAVSRELKIHRATLTRLVHRHCGVAPGEYLMSFRIQQALSKLANSRDSIKEIAAATGFADANYFAKVMRRRFGKAPSDMR